MRWSLAIRNDRDHTAAAAAAAAICTVSLWDNARSLLLLLLLLDRFLVLGNMLYGRSILAMMGL